MPIYEYKCKRCGHKFEILQKFSDHPLTCCPECKKESLVKVISAPSFQLKGSGWYESDYKSKGSEKASEKQKTTETKKEDKKDD